MMIDFHCHILPGIDDGSPDMETSLKMAKQAVEYGITHIVTTTHGNSESLSTILPLRNEKLEILRRELKAQNIPLQLIPGLEYCADGHSDTAALEMPSCRCGEEGLANRPLLLELPFSMDVKLVSTILFKAQLKGLTLILAHPERYVGFEKHIDLFKELLDKGMYLQFNAQSLVERLLFNGRMKTILKIMQYDLEHILIGSDAHDAVHRPAGFWDAQELICRKLGEDVWTKITWTTPASLVLTKTY